MEPDLPEEHAGHGANGAAHTNGTDALSRSSAAAMRRLLHAYHDGWMVDADVREAARLISEDAHRAGIDAVRMIIAIRASWVSHDERRRIMPDDARDLSGRLISCAIEMFYGPRAALDREDRASA